MARKRKLIPSTTNVKTSGKGKITVKGKAVPKAGLEKAMAKNYEVNRSLNTEMITSIATKEKGGMPLNEYAADNFMMSKKRWNFSKPGRSRAKFLATLPYSEVSPPPVEKPKEKVKSGDIELTSAQAKYEAKLDPRLENIHEEYLRNRNIPISRPKKEKPAGPSLEERTKVGRRPK